jgi:hypothetical protein
MTDWEILSYSRRNFRKYAKTWNALPKRHVLVVFRYITMPAIRSPTAPIAEPPIIAGAVGWEPALGVLEVWLDEFWVVLVELVVVTILVLGVSLGVDVGVDVGVLSVESLVFWEVEVFPGCDGEEVSVVVVEMSVDVAPEEVVGTEVVEWSLPEWLSVEWCLCEWVSVEWSLPEWVSVDGDEDTTDVSIEDKTLETVDSTALLEVSTSVVEGVATLVGWSSVELVGAWAETKAPKSKAETKNLEYMMLE